MRMFIAAHSDTAHEPPAGVVIYGYCTFVDAVLTMTGNDDVPARDPLTGEM